MTALVLAQQAEASGVSLGGVLPCGAAGLTAHFARPVSVKFMPRHTRSSSAEPRTWGAR